MREIYRLRLFLGNNTASMAIVKKMVLIIIERILGFWVGDFEESRWAFVVLMFLQFIKRSRWGNWCLRARACRSLGFNNCLGGLIGQL